MGGGKEKVQIENTNLENAIMLLVGIMAEVRPILQDEGLDYERGLVIFCENKEIYRQAWGIFQDMGAVKCKSVARKEWKIPNNRMGIYSYNKYDSEKGIFQFLQEEGFSPVLMAFGMAPDYLRREQNIIVLRLGTDMQEAQILHTFQGFCSNIRNNPDLIQRQIRLCRSAEFLQQACGEPLYISLGTAAEIFCSYFREKHDETQTRELRGILHQAISQSRELAECYAEDLESTGFIKKALENYIDGNGCIQIGKIDEIEGELAKAVQEEEAVLFDEEFYYIPEKILRKACESFRDSVSILSVKRALFDSGFLCCNDAKEGNYTVKKLLTNAYGCSFRPRFLKIKKEFFISGGSLGLEERRKKCTLEISTENYAG